MEKKALLELLEGFRITDRALLRARERAERGHGANGTATLEQAARRYFASLEREATQHLAAIDSRLDDLYQRQYNLQAERGVAERRLLCAQRALAALDATRGASAGKETTPA